MAGWVTRMIPALLPLLIAGCGSTAPQPSTPTAQQPTTTSVPREAKAEPKPKPKPRFTAAQVAAYAGWKPYEDMGSGSDSGDGYGFSGWINHDGCYIKELLLTRAAVEDQLWTAPRRTDTPPRDSTRPWTATNPAGDIGLVGEGRLGQGAYRWHGFDCHASLAADLSRVP